MAKEEKKLVYLIFFMMGAIVHKKKVAPGVDLKFLGFWPLGAISLNIVGLVGLTKHFISFCGYIGTDIVNCFSWFVFGFTIGFFSNAVRKPAST